MAIQFNSHPIPNNNVSVIKIGGYIDTTTSSELEHALNTLLKSGSYNIIIDLGNVDYVSSAGWGIFISEIKGIREKGGDLKLVRMIPEVYEVFELLEFHYILKAFDTLEDAVRDFERSNGGIGKNAQVVEVDPGDFGENRAQSVASEKQDQPEPNGNKLTTVEDKVKNIVAKYPNAGTSQIVRLLNSSEYGYAKVGWFGLRKILKKAGLDSKKKRLEHARTYQS